MRGLKEININGFMETDTLDYMESFMEKTLTLMDEAADFKDRLEAAQSISTPKLDLLERCWGQTPSRA